MTDPKITNDVPPPADTALEPGQLPNEVEPPSRAHQVLRDIVGGSAMISFLAVVLALVAGGILIALTDKDVQAAAGYFFARPADLFRAIWDAVSGAYVALFQGSIYNFRRPGFADGIRPLTETLTFATPLIAAGLGVAVAFRAGLFNIGGRGQMLVAAGAAGYVGFAWPLPFGIHLIVAVAMGMLAGAIWGGIVGLLKARTGAHEVIVTIMLNYVAYYLIAFLLRTPGALQAPGSTNPKSPAMLPTAVFPELFGPKYNLHLGFLFAIAATIWVWYLINRSNLGFQFRAVGENPNAARVAGMNVKNIYVYAMLISGGLIGLAGVAQAEAPRGPVADDDDGLDEVERFAPALTIRDPGIPGCTDPASTALGPSIALTNEAVRPPSDGFFAPDAVFLGAVRDDADTWATASWTRWD